MKKLILKIMQKILRVLGYTIEAGKYFLLYPFAIIKYRNRDIYLIAERGDEARDNGYHLFKYFRTVHPEREVYYVIRRDSVDRPKIEQYGHIVDYKSLKHYMLFIAAKYKISTHIMGFSPNRLFYSFHFKNMPIIGKTVFLQHGIIKDDIPALYYENTQLSLFICGAKPEFEYVRNHFHYKDGIVQYTGLARYDALNSFETKSQILVMPTWRQYLKYADENSVKNSDYIKVWRSVLQNEKLMQVLQENDITLFFYPHYEMQKYADLFNTSNDRIVIAKSDEYDVQQLLKESDMLITDYSSVFFDFAYMKKPCVYYQFDKDAFMSGHYSKGYFDYETMGFGPVFMSEKCLVDYVVSSINNNYCVDMQYLNRMNAFFTYSDKFNCERIVAAIDRL